MKRILLTIAFVVLALMASAQSDNRKANRGQEHKGGMKIEEFVSDLSAEQQSKIDEITKRSAKTIESYRKQLKAVRDIIRSYMDSPDDHSEDLFPLYEHEGRIQAYISKEYYRTKVAIDKLLTPAQYKELREKMKAQKKTKKQ